MVSVVGKGNLVKHQKVLKYYENDCGGTLGVKNGRKLPISLKVIFRRCEFAQTNDFTPVI